MIAGYEQAFFLHVPKTGGESFGRALREFANVAEIHRIPPLNDEAFFAALRAAADHPVVQGHAPLPVSRILREPLLVATFLRSPVERVVSSFEYLQRSELAPHQRQREAWRDKGIDTVDDLVEKGGGGNQQTRMLGVAYNLAAILEKVESGELSPAQARRRIRRRGRTQVDDRVLERARKRLEQLSFFGITEAFDESLRLFAHMFGLQEPKRAHRTNAAPAQQRAARATRYEAATLKAIADANHLDQELYSFAVDLFTKRYEEAFGRPPHIEEPLVQAPSSSSGKAVSEPTRGRVRVPDEKEIDRLKAELGVAREGTAALRAELEEARGENARLNARLHELEAAATARLQGLDAVQREVASSRMALEMMRSSRSWRLTKPLRARPRRDRSAR